MAAPRYEFSGDVLRDNYLYLKEKLSSAECYYALKANANPDILCILHRLGSKFEAASIEEFSLLLDIGVDAEDIIFGLPVKPANLIDQLSYSGCGYFVFDHMRELEKLERFAAGSKKILRLFITDLLERCIPYGMPKDEIVHHLNKNDLASRIDGISFHITTNNSLPDVSSVLDRSETIISKVRQKHNKPFVLNIGGGYPTRRYPDYFDMLNEKLSLLKERYQLNILIEPGRSIVNSAGKYIAEIILIKEADEYLDIYINGGDPHGVKFAQKISVLEESDTKGKKICRIIGMTCKHEVLGVARLRKNIKEGEHIVFEKVGAYTLCERNDFHQWDKPDVQVFEPLNN